MPACRRIHRTHGEVTWVSAMEVFYELPSLLQRPFAQQSDDVQKGRLDSSVIRRVRDTAEMSEFSPTKLARHLAGFSSSTSAAEPTRRSGGRSDPRHHHYGADGGTGAGLMELCRGRAATLSLIFSTGWLSSDR